MKVLKTIFIGALLSYSVVARGAITSVVATGTCPTDLSAIQNAFDGAAPGDIIQLSSGPASQPFNFTCLSGGAGPTLQTIAIKIEAAPGGSPIIMGPGSASGQVAFVILSDDVTVTGIDFHGFSVAIAATNPGFIGTDPGPANFTVTHCHFEDNGIGVLVLGVADHFRFTNNSVQVPAPGSPAAGSNTGVVITTRDNDLLIADNTITGPGATGLLTSLQQLLNPTIAFENAAFQTIGILQVDVANPASVRGRISGNTLTGLDLGIQSSSNFGVVMQNTASNCAIGMQLSNDTDDGSTAVTDSLVSLNTSINNKIGFVVLSGRQNTIALNNFADNSLAGLFFVANIGGASSVGNKYGCNQGTVRNAEGNQRLPACFQDNQDN